jgi:tetratricopeptide (TPR) repeat protein
MRNKLLPLATLTAFLLLPLTQIARAADDFVRESIPGKWIAPLLPEDLEKLDYPAYFKDLDKARLESFTGRYKLSLLTLKKAQAANPPPDPLQVALIRATSQSALGQKEAALKTLSADPKISANPKSQILRARILSDLSQHDAAITLLQQVINKDKDSVPAHYYLAQINETAGHTDAAKKAYAFFEPYIDKLFAQEFDDAEELTLIGRGIDRWATLNSAYKDRLALHNTIMQKCFGQAYLTVDRDYYPAKVAAAEFNAARDDEKTAVELLNQVLEQNPRDIRALALIGTLAVKQFNFDGGDHAVDLIRKVDTTSIEADILETRNMLQQRRPKDAQRIITRVLARQPNNIEANGLLAAVYALQLHEPEMNAVLAKVDKLDPANARAYLEVAEQLSAMRQYPRAAAKYLVAIQRAPWWTDAYNGLGLLYTQSGDEDLAFKVLEQARVLDPFNYATTNYLKLLDDYRKYAKKESAHFVVVYDEKTDPVIPLYFSDYLESIYTDVTGAFKHAPEKKTYIEVFPTHDAFSVRTTGSPWIGTVGASTGSVIAMVAPRKGKHTMGPYNWAQVLRHEFTHTVTLSATDNRIAHWLTEGLAVYEEQTPLRWEWVPMLYDAVKKKKLFTMDNLTWGFVRPKKPADRQLAYAQSYWICKYIEDTFGHDKMLAMLEEFRKGREQSDVFPEILGKSLSDFQTDFFAWTEKEVSTWGYDDETTKKYNTLVKEAEDLIKSRQYQAALKSWQEILKLRPMDALPHQRLAGLYLTKQINQPAKAIEHLVRLHQVELHDNRYAKRIARVYRDIGQLDQAIAYATQSVYVDPYDTDAHELLADLFEKNHNENGAERERKTLAILEDWSKSGTEAERATNPGS